MNKYCFLGNYTETDEILVTMERYQEYYQDALDGIAQMEKTKALILESKSINNRELRLIQQGAMGWANYLELPPKRRPSLEMRAGYTNKELALETVNAVHGGLFAVALAIIAWIISAIAKLFRGGGGGSSGGGGGASGIPEASRKKADEALKKMKESHAAEQAKNKEAIDRLERREVTSAKLKVLGLRGPVIKEEDIKEALEKILKLSIDVKKSLVTLSGLATFQPAIDQDKNPVISPFDSAKDFLEKFLEENGYIQTKKSRIQDYGLSDFTGEGVYALPLIEDNVVLVVYKTGSGDDENLKAKLVSETKHYEPCDVFVPSDPNKKVEFATLVHDLVYKDIDNVITYIAREVSSFDRRAEKIKKVVEKLSADKEKNKEAISHYVKMLKFLQFLIVFYGRFNSSVTNITVSIYEGIMAPVRI